MWECNCDCGSICVVQGNYLVSGNTKSCGCRKTGPKSRYTTDERNLRNVWDLMLYRCYDRNSNSYPYYGGRGITVCDDWRHDLAAFARDMGPRPSPAHSLDRIDGSRGYEPGNCRWVTRAQQTANRRNSINVVVDGKVMSLREASEHDGIPYHVARYRADRGTYYPVLPRVISKRRKAA